MFDLFVRLFRNEAGFSAIEYGLVAALLLAAAGQLVANKL